MSPLRNKNKQLALPELWVSGAADDSGGENGSRKKGMSSHE